MRIVLLVVERGEHEKLLHSIWSPHSRGRLIAVPAPSRTARLQSGLTKPRPREGECGASYSPAGRGTGNIEYVQEFHGALPLFLHDLGSKCPGWGRNLIRFSGAGCAKILSRNVDCLAAAWRLHAGHAGASV